MLGRIGEMLGISFFASKAKRDSEKMIADSGKTYQSHVSREEALKKRKSRKTHKAQKKARRANRRK
jgi:hypothetical protein